MASSDANDVNISVEESRSCTNINVAKISHTWTIRNFRFCQSEVGHYLQSVTFPLESGEEHKTEWCINLYPAGMNKAGMNKECDGYLSVAIVLMAAKKHEVNGMLTMGLVNAKGERHTIVETRNLKFQLRQPIRRHEFVKLNDILDKTSGLMQDNDLVVFCEVVVSMNISTTWEELNVIQCTQPGRHLLTKIGNLFETKKLSDVTITACGKEFQAHKSILAAQSPVFSAMFEHDMEEKKQSHVDIIDIDDEVVKEMLLFLYTGKVNNIQKTAVGLLAAADKYALEELKTMCEEALRISLTIENAADTLILADLHSADRLKQRVISFICFHAADVVSTSGFKLMVQSHPSLFVKGFCQTVLRKNDDSHEVSEIDEAASKLNACAMNAQ